MEQLTFYGFIQTNFRQINGACRNVYVCAESKNAAAKLLKSVSEQFVELGLVDFAHLHIDDILLNSNNSISEIKVIGNITNVIDNIVAFGSYEKLTDNIFCDIVG